MHVLFVLASTMTYMQSLEQGIICHNKVAYEKQLAHYLLQDISRNATDPQKWTIFYMFSVRNAIIAWDKAPPHITTNCFMKGAFGTKAAKEIEFEQDDSG